MKVLERQGNGAGEELRLQLGQGTDLSKSVEHVATSQELREEINALLVLERLDKLHNARVVTLSVDVSLHDDCFLLVCLDDVPLLHALQGVERVLLGLRVDQAHHAEGAPADDGLALEVRHRDVEVLKVHSALQLLAEHADDVEKGVVVEAEADALLHGLARRRAHLREQQAALPEVVPTPEVSQHILALLDDDRTALDQEEVLRWVALLHDDLSGRKVALLQAPHHSVDLLHVQIFEQEDVAQHLLDVVHPRHV
mmetsp:Transcript_144797/g.464079  ORF Transcript_144797/g.464079 Transcript_144797/m.464079 type:complete len:255 (+) Transcript_144797:721-1485(+)